MKFIDKLLNMNHKKNIVFYIMAGIFIISLIPLFIIARYNVPCADDYSYGLFVHQAWENTHSFTEVILAACRRVSLTYKNWQGAFAAVFIFSLQPAVFGEEFYFLVPIIMLGGLILSTFFFCRAFFDKLLGSGRNFIIIAFVWLFIDIQMIPSAVQGFYWFNGSSYYTLFYSLSLFLYGLIILFSISESTIKKVVYFPFICILSFIIGGGNYVTSLFTVLIFAVIMVILKVNKNNSVFAFILPLIILLTSFFINITAPGNAIRQAQYISPGVFKSIVMSFDYALRLFIISRLMLLPWIIFLFPILWKTVSQSKLSFRYPLLVLLFTFCLYAAQFCPPIYAMNTLGDERLTNIIFYSYIFLMIFNVFYIMGWFKKKFECKKFNNIMEKNSLNIILLVVSLLFLIVYDFMPQRHISTISAVESLCSGEAKEYYSEYTDRLIALKDKSKKDITFSPYSQKPYLLFFDDATDNKDDWRNIDLCKYYDKDSVIIMQK